MSFTYTFKQDPKPLGEYDAKFGQRYWTEVNEMDYPIMFNTMEKEAIDLEDKIEAEEQVMKKSAKGNEYYGLKKVKVHRAHGNMSAQVSETAQTASTEPTGPSKADNPQLDRIEKQLALILEGINELKYGPQESEDN